MNSATEPSSPRTPTGTTARFIMLIAAILATGSVVFTYVYAQVPGNVDRLVTGGRACQDTRDQQLAVLGDIDSIEKLDRSIAIWRESQRCTLHFLWDQARFVGYGLLILFTLATVLYLAHPQWIRRRGRLRRLSATEMPELVSYLDACARESGLGKPPQWWWAPRSATIGGQAFGTPWRRGVRLDAGLLVQYSADRPVFRAVVLHELAHLRNRDVDITYYTIAVWRAFVVVALLPMAAFIIHPLLVTAPRLWHWRGIGFLSDTANTLYRVASLAVLGGLVYLTRNAILRVREIHADAVAATHDGVGPTLASVIDRLPRLREPTWIRRWGRHPDPVRRREAVADPRLLLRGGTGDLVEVGILGGVFGTNVGFLVTSYTLLDTITGRALVGLLAGTLMVVVLAVVVWRRTTFAPEGGNGIASWLLPPVYILLGYVLGSVVSFNTVNTAVVGRIAGTEDLVSTLVSAAILLVLQILTTVWVVSTARLVAGREHRPRWAMPATVATAVLAAMAWFPVWFAHYEIDAVWKPSIGDPPVNGGEIAWYHTLSLVSGFEIGPLYRIYHHPLVPIALTLLWLVPIVIARHGAALRLAVRAGLAGGLAMIAVAAVLPFAAKAALRDRVRLDPEVLELDTMPFAAVYAFTFITVAVLAQAVVAAVVVTRARAQRPALVLLAINICATLASVALYWVLTPMSCRINLFVLDPAPTGCLRMPEGTWMATVNHMMLVKGVLISVVVATIAGLIHSLVRRTDPDPNPDPDPPRPSRFTVTVSAIVVIANLGFLVLGLPYAYDVWLSALLG